MNDTPVYIPILFVAATLIALLFFYYASNQSKRVLLICVGWLLLQGATALTGFYEYTKGTPPRVVLLVAPTIVVMIYLLVSKHGKVFTQSLNLPILHAMHVVRVIVELGLHYLFIYKVIPSMMTFNGINFDIFAGISALPIFYFGFVKNSISKNGLIVWNVVCLLLLLTILTVGILSVETAFQQLNFNMPNKALGYFPYVWLPCFIVPLILYTHILSIQRLIKDR